MAQVLNLNDADFPYGFSSPVESTESGEDVFFAELNGRLTLSEYGTVEPLDLRPTSEIPKASGGSPQSILGGVGSWSGRSSNDSLQSPLRGRSPPATPYEMEYDAVGLLNEAAVQVEQLNMRAEVNLMLPFENHNASFMDQQNYLAAARRAYNAALIYEQHLQNLNSSVRYTKQISSVSTNLFTQSPLESLQPRQPRVSTKARFQSAPIQRKESVGTGVFIPRTCNPAPAALPRMSHVAKNAVVSAKVVHALNKSFEEMNSQSQEPHYNAYAASQSHKNYEVLTAKRNAILAQQQRRVARADDFVQNNTSIEVCLPQEWSY